MSKLSRTFEKLISTETDLEVIIYGEQRFSQIAMLIRVNESMRE